MIISPLFIPFFGKKGTIIVALTVKEEEGRGEGIRYILENANLDIDTSLCGEACMHAA